MTLLTCHRQVAGSDVILLNKVDLVDPQEVLALEDALHKVNPAAPVHRTIRGEIDLGQIMGISAYSSAPQLLPTASTTSTGLHHDHEHVHSEDCDHPHEPTHYELRGISSLQVSCPVLSPSRFSALDEWIRTVLWENTLPGSTDTPDLQVLRCKGLFFTDSGEQYVLQGVRNMYEISKVEGQDIMGVPETGKLVLIGKGLGSTVRQSLYDLLNKPS